MGSHVFTSKENQLYPCGCHLCKKKKPTFYFRIECEMPYDYITQNVLFICVYVKLKKKNSYFPLHMKR